MSEEQPAGTAYAIDWVKTVGGGLAAIVVAVLASFLGTAGTLIGAAIGSVVATVATALISQGLERSRRAAAAVQSTALSKVGLAHTEVLRAVRRGDQGDDEAATAHLEHAEEKLAEAEADLEGDPEEAADGAAGGDDATDDSLLGRLRSLGWKRIALIAGGTFLVVMVVISAVELTTGRSVAQLTGGSSGDGGTSFGNLVGGGSDTDEDDGRDPSDGPGQQQSDDGSGGEPTDDATDQATEEPTDEESEEPTEEPTTPATPTTPPTPGATTPTG